MNREKQITWKWINHEKIPCENKIIMKNHMGKINELCKKKITCTILKSVKRIKRLKTCKKNYTWCLCESFVNESSAECNKCNKVKHVFQVRWNVRYCVTSNVSISEHAELELNWFLFCFLISGCTSLS